MLATCKFKLLPGLLAAFWEQHYHQPPSADPLKDAAVGAASNVVTGAVLKWYNCRQCCRWGCAGAAVSATHNRSNRRVKSVVQDAAVGAVTNVVTGEVIRNGRTVDNAIGGAAAGVRQCLETLKAGLPSRCDHYCRVRVVVPFPTRAIIPFGVKSNEREESIVAGWRCSQLPARITKRTSDNCKSVLHVKSSLEY